jgi:hypothetical protein
MAYKNAFKQWKKYLETGVVSRYDWHNIHEDGSYIL